MASGLYKLSGGVLA